MTRPRPDPRRRQLLGAVPALGAIGLWAMPLAGAAQAVFPQRPITLVVPFGPGGVADITARTVGQAMAASLGQSVVIDNKPGAGGIVATQAVLSAPADGHTLLMMSNATAVSVHLVKKLPFDVVKDLAPISTLGTFELGLAVAQDSRFKTLQDVLAHARANPGKLTIGTIAVGSTQHLSAELFKSRAGIDAVVVPYKGSPAVINALRTGEIDLAFEILSPLLPQISARTIRALAVTGPQRFSLLPEVPTVVEQGIAHYTVDSWNALAAPAGTPPAVIERIRRAAQEALSQPAVRDKLRDLGVKAQASTPAEQAALLAREIRHWGEVVKAAKIEAE
ncbi:Bug family tripartite tricarboxylate transporter substrate binding protein [Sphaerotilus mobilis]|uniref:Tripartite-type tricarboxylate transporter receptor subunit TctC n=1 Tax=Sphaerotilus mobilis TaxID=47994 RepID=A0A4V2EWT3_9BURK|nr:tripartite tricarboxylate transporter substrate binding protein [Sphaerotilus mobilis]RZS57090.1 tripartite-type tricarboxylate transporter receptor subunit TctC [Sphaerotilus mobilis]